MIHAAHSGTPVSPAEAPREPLRGVTQRYLLNNKTAASRQKFVSSRVTMFLNGNIPAAGGFGGPGIAAGIFDGFDIDWEYPGSSGGHLGNHVDPTNDPANFTALLAEFRSELDAYGAAHGGKHYSLTAALPSGQDKVKYIETNQIGQYLDLGNIMTCDMHGAWDATGPTNFQDPLYTSPSDPMTAIAPGTGKYRVDEAMKPWTAGAPAYGIPGGFPANKATIGFPVYYRRWTGVQAGSNHGLYQAAAGPSQGYKLSGNVPASRCTKKSPTSSATRRPPSTIRPPGRPGSTTGPTSTSVTPSSPSRPRLTTSTATGTPAR